MSSEILSRSARIAELNDHFRKTGKGGKTVMTQAVAQLPAEIVARAQIGPDGVMERFCRPTEVSAKLHTSRKNRACDRPVAPQQYLAARHPTCRGRSSSTTVRRQSHPL